MFLFFRRSCRGVFFFPNFIYYINFGNNISITKDASIFKFVYTVEEFEKKYPFKIGDTVKIKGGFSIYKTIDFNISPLNRLVYILDNNLPYITEKLELYKQSKKNTIDKTFEKLENIDNKGNISDGYHTFNELYEYRALYNAAFFNGLVTYVEKTGNWVVNYDVHKSKKHFNGEDCFGGGWFIVMAELPTGQISNHYELKDWDLFQVPEKEKANKWDEHTPQDVAKRMRKFLTPKPKYPKTYEECAKILLDRASIRNDLGYKGELLVTLQKLLVCRDAYWKIAGDEMGLGKPWKLSIGTPIYYIYYNRTVGTVKNDYADDIQGNVILAFPTKEMLDVFYENFKELIEQCKELL